MDLDGPHNVQVSSYGQENNAGYKVWRCKNLYALSKLRRLDLQVLHIRFIQDFIPKIILENWKKIIPLSLDLSSECNFWDGETVGLMSL